MPVTERPATFCFGNSTVNRLGYGAMQLAGPGVFGPPKNHDEALAVLREAISLGINHIDTSDFYGPHITNKLIREALSPYPEDLVIVTKIGGRRDDKGGWLPAMTPEELRHAVEDNRRNLDRDVIDVVNLRLIGDLHSPGEGSLARELEVVAEMQQRGLIRHVGLSNVTLAQIEEGQGICDIVCVQNMYNLAHRSDDTMVDTLAAQGVAYVPFFPLGGFSPLQSDALSVVANQLGATPMQVALAWLLHRSPNILLIPGTSSVTHLRENAAAATLLLPEDALRALDQIAN